ncbi:MAG TPA: CDP-alcohol phosphatidyltransferase family protein [Flavobacteriales bacterium]|nr:CDP-alcohol phosphatidyltransferase family protein [Flavobacteriales bacterium]
MARLPRLPDLLTTANLACGVLSILLASQGQLTAACWLVFAAAVFDVFDGLAARALGGGSPLGAQLDSLADLVSFGVAPGMILWEAPATLADPYGQFFGLVAAKAIGVVCITVASAWRLAKFNLDTRQTSGFLGLPTPSNGLFWVSLTMGASGTAVHPGPGHDTLIGLAVALMSSPLTLLAVALVLGTLMLSELPLPSLKFKHFRWPGNQVIYLLGGLGAVLVVLYGILAVPLILMLYLLSPVWGRLFKPQVARDK